MINASESGGVYSDRTNADAGVASLERVTVRINLENCSTALPRLFGVLGTLDLVPAETRSLRLPNGSLAVELTLANLDAAIADRLQRKLQQLPETIQVVCLP